MHKTRWSLILMLFGLSVWMPVMATETDDGLGLWVETQVVSRNPSRVMGWYEKDFTDSIGFFAFAEKESDGYRQFYVGPTWKPTEWLKLGAGIGREVVPGEFSSVRRGLFFDANWRKINFFGAFESGASGRWHKITGTYALTESVGAGLMHETGLGLGPRFEYNIKKDVQVWGALLRNPTTKESTTVFAINFSF